MAAKPPPRTARSFSALEDEPWIEACWMPTRPHSLPRFSALEDEPWIEARDMSRLPRPMLAVSVLLKTSRGLKQRAAVAAALGWEGFSALEDEPWIEATR